MGARFYATFQPVQVGTLKPGVERWIGQRFLWEALWCITEEDGGPYVGQWACTPIQADPYRLLGLEPAAWAPLEDLTDIEWTSDEHAT